MAHLHIFSFKFFVKHRDDKKKKVWANLALKGPSLSPQALGPANFLRSWHRLKLLKSIMNGLVSLSFIIHKLKKIKSKSNWKKKEQNAKFNKCPCRVPVMGQGYSWLRVCVVCDYYYYYSRFCPQINSIF